MKLFCNACDGIYDSLDVRFCKACDNSCNFCIEKNGLPDLGMADIEVLIKDTIDSGIKSVLILGGEPLLYPERVLLYLRGIRPFMDTIYLTTSLPNTINSHWRETIAILTLLDGLNVSVQHYNWEENNKVFNASSNHNRLEILQKLNDIVSTKIRTSINLVKGQIDTKLELINALATLRDYGCKHIKINELQHVEDMYVSYEEIMGKKLPSPFAHGCSTYIKLKHFEDIKILLKRSCFLVEESRKASVTDLLKAYLRKYFKRQNKFAVMYENGMIQGGWGHEN